MYLISNLGELVRGVKKSQQVERNLRDIKGFAARLEILDFTQNAGTHFGQIRSSLEMVGQTIGAYDQMISGHARSLGLILITSN